MNGPEQAEVAQTGFGDLVVELCKVVDAMMILPEIDLEEHEVPELMAAAAREIDGLRMILRMRNKTMQMMAERLRYLASSAPNEEIPQELHAIARDMERVSS